MSDSDCLVSNAARHVCNCCVNILLSESGLGNGGELRSLMTATRSASKVWPSKNCEISTHLVLTLQLTCTRHSSGSLYIYVDYRSRSRPDRPPRRVPTRSWRNTSHQSEPLHDGEHNSLDSLLLLLNTPCRILQLGQQQIPHLPHSFLHRAPHFIQYPFLLLFS